MNLKKLKMHLGVLTLSNLEEAGFVNSEDESPADGVIIRVTSDDHNKEFNEVMWASSVNNEGGRLALLMHAILYDKATAKEMGRPAEVAQVFMNKEKAAMILDTIRHAYPELLAEMENVPVGGALEEDEEEGVDLFSADVEEDEDNDDSSEASPCDADHCSICGDPLDEDDPLDAADMEAGPTPEQAPSVLTSDQIIDAHLLVKKELQRVTRSESEVKTLKVAEPYEYLYLTVPRENELAITFDELDIVHQVKEAVNPAHLLKEDAARLLLDSIYEAFPNLKKSEH
jgi:hypothetical protein